MKGKDIYKLLINKGKYLVYLLIVSVFFSGLWILENGYFKSIFEKIGVYPVHEKYTTLFFTDSEKLSDISTNELKEFTFGVTNKEGSDLKYEYVVGVATNGIFVTLKKDTISVVSGETAYQTVSVDTAAYRDGSVISVQLPSYNKSIDFEI